ncbi:MAG: hypothetical protein AVDCRST_MAG77-836 [uncultured Chloroflexi bacterium]|uniref:Uncharacterized protein n=1 Tax=uncultured Chloroflexota bacterium TaxID=166587 RepID=A0A6J4HLP0_9CHLR|nr:MAG: hypothetical protein AVDCRST_MAG77-836 [uncultured Chloroflexota bacterium]
MPATIRPSAGARPARSNRRVAKGTDTRPPTADESKYITGAEILIDAGMTLLRG